jgi:hypothetical protein
VEGDLVEELGGVPLTEVARPAAQEPVELAHDFLDRSLSRERAVIARWASGACRMAWRLLAFQGQRTRKGEMPWEVLPRS